MEDENRKKSPPQILIVDDLEVNVSILENIIQMEGYVPLCALNVQEAMDIMRDTMPQLILSDVTMPGMNGLEFCKLLKSNPKTREIPVIFITVGDSSEEKRAAFQAGAVDFIPKPFEPIEVIMRVNNQLESYRIKQEMKDYNRLMHKMVAEQKAQLQKERQGALLALIKVLKRRNGYLGDHLEKVGYNSRLLAQSLQLGSKYEDLISDEFVEAIETAAKLHSLGKIVEVQGRDAGFYAEEGAKILEEFGAENNNDCYLNMAIQIARYHHAGWDGSGYPGVKGAEIPLAARITAVANDFDMLQRTISCGADCRTDEALRIISGRSGVMYDPVIVEVFNKIKRQLKTS